MVLARRAIVSGALCVAACWLAIGATSAVANPIQQENAKRGTPGWDIGAPPSAVMDGYTSSISVRPGQRLGFHVGGQAGSRYRIVVYRLGWYQGYGARLVACLPSCKGSKAAVQQRPVPPPDANGTVDAGWPTTDTLRIGRNWVSGYYLAEFLITRGPDAGQAGRYPFIVVAPRSRRSAILVQVPVNTWEAYSSWGGKSLYTYNSSGGVAATKVSFNRPLSNDNAPVFGWEYNTLRFLERNGYDVSYQTDVDTDRDPGSLMRHALIMSVGHNEYWTGAMRSAFEAARDAGHNLIFMGADVSDWQVRYEQNRRLLVGYKTNPDPITDPAQKTTSFANLVPPRPPCKMLGNAYQGGLVAGGIAHLNYTVAPGAGGNPWLAGTGLAPGQVLPGLVGYEWDGVVPECVPGVQVLFHYAGPPAADAVVYTASSGARVFSTGSLQFAWALDTYDWGGHGNLTNAGIQGFMLNMLDDMAPHSRPATTVTVGLKVPHSLRTRARTLPMTAGCAVESCSLRLVARALTRHGRWRVVARLGSEHRRLRMNRRFTYRCHIASGALSRIRVTIADHNPVKVQVVATATDSSGNSVSAVRWIKILG